MNTAPADKAQSMKALRYLLPVVLAFTSHLAAAVPAFKVIASPGLVDPNTADAYYCAHACNTSGTADLWSSGYPPEITALANALHNNVDLIYEYVHDNIDTVPMYGLQKGALGAMIDRSGTPFDQAQLMVDLLRASGYTAGYVQGTAAITAAQFGLWFNISNGASVAKILADGGIPATVDSSGNASAMAHIWVSVVIGGTTYYFDPSFKTHTYTPPLNVGTAMGYSDTTFFAAAQSGMQTGTATDASGTVSVPWVSNLNSANVKSQMTGYANNLLAYFNANNLADKQIDDIIGRNDIISNSTGNVRFTSPPNAVSGNGIPATHVWAGNIPDAYRTKLEVNFVNNTGVNQYTSIFDRTFFADEVYGRQIEIDSELGPATNTGGGTSVSSYNFALMVDHQVLMGPFNATYPTYNGGERLTLNIDHPYAASSGSYMDESTDVGQVVDPRTPIIVIFGLGDVSEALRTKLDSEGTEDNNTQQLGVCWTTSPYNFHSSCSSGDSNEGMKVSYHDHSLTTIGYDWLAQYTRMVRLQTGLTPAVVQNHHMLGAAFTQDGFYPDAQLLLSVESAVSINSTTGDATARPTLAQSIPASADMLEGSVFEQALDTTDSASVAARFAWGTDNANNDGTATKFYLLNNTKVGGAQADFSGVFKDMSYTHNYYTQPATLTWYPALSYLQATGTTGINPGFTQLIVPDNSFLGPGANFGSVPQPPNTAGDYRPNARGGAFIAFGSSADSSYAVAQAISLGVQSYKGGGSGTGPVLQQDYAPGDAAQALKDSFKDRSKQFGVDLGTGDLSYSAPTDLSVGNNGFPYQLDFKRSFKAGGGHSAGLGDGWSHNWDIRLQMGSNAMATMGDGPVSPSVSALAALYVTQQIYKTQPGTPAALLQRWIVAPLVQSWWQKQILHNTVTRTSGGSAEQYVRLPIDLAATDATTYKFNPPKSNVPSIGTSYPKLVQTGIPTPEVTNGSIPDGAYLYTGLSFKFTSPQNDVQSFAYWGGMGQTEDASLVAAAHGFHITSWTFPFGMSLSFSYIQPVAYANQGSYDAEHYISDDRLLSVSNSIGRSLTFNYYYSSTLSPYEGATGPGTKVQSCYFTSVTDETGRSASLPCTPHNPANVAGVPDTTLMTLATSPGGLLSQYQYQGVLTAGSYCTPTAGARPQCYPLLNAIFQPSDTSHAKEALTYDALGRVATYRDGVSILYPSIRGAYQFYLTGNSRGERMDPLGYSYATYYDRWGRAIQYIDELGRKSAATYDGFNRVLTRAAPEGDWSAFGYDVNGNMISLVRHPVSATSPVSVPATIGISAAYDTTCGKLGSFTDANSKTTTWNYDHSGTCELLSVVQPQVTDARTNSLASPTTTYTYTTVGLKKTVTDPSGLVVQYGYDSAWNLTSRSVMNLTTTYAYDSSGTTNDATIGIGNITAATDANTHTTFYAYDADRRVLQVNEPTTDGVCNQTRNIYSGELLTQIQQATDCTGNNWITLKTTSYSASDQPLAVTDASNDQVLTVYDADDRATDSIACLAAGSLSWSNPNAPACPSVPAGQQQRTTHTVYDAAGEVANVYKGWGTTDQITYSTTTYGNDGEVLTVKDADNNLTTNVYDGYLRLWRMCLPDSTGTCSTSPNDYEQYAYDNNGNLTGKQNRDGRSITTAYDALNRETSRTVPLNAQNHFAQTLTTGYDPAGRKWNITLTDTETGTASSQTLAIRYDSAMRPTSVDDSLLAALNSGCTIGTSRCPGSVVTALDNVGNRTGQTLYGVGSTTYTETYGYDALNRVRSISDSIGTEASYQPYDYLGHPTSATWGSSAGTTTWSFQPNDDLISLAHSLGGTTTSWNLSHNGGHQIIGETLSSTGLEMKDPGTPASYTVNSLNQYTQAAGKTLSYDKDGNLTGDGTWVYEYDEENRLRLASGPHSVLYDYDPMGRRRSKTVDGTITRYTSDGSEEIAEWSSSAITTRYINGDGTDDHIALLDYTCGTPPCRSFYYADWHGSTVVMGSTAGATAASYRYDAYGFSNDALTGNPFRYTGRRLDAETGLYYYRARYYSPTLGRFLQTDPISGRDDLNLYVYTHNDSINGADPTGLDDNQGKPTGKADEKNRDRTPSSGGFISIHGGRIAIVGALTGIGGDDEQAQISGSGSDFSFDVNDSESSERGEPAAGSPITSQDPLPQLEKLRDAALQASASVSDKWPPWLRGILVHLQFARNVSNMGLQFAPEVSYREGIPVGYGTKGSVRADAVAGSILKPNFAVDLKTGGAYVTKGQMDNYTKNLPVGTPVYEIKVP